MSRRIVQIADIQSSVNTNGERVSGLFALCDDGTLWVRSKGITPEQWLSYENVPQHQVPGYAGSHALYPVHPTD